MNAGACQTPPLNTQNCFLFDKPLVAAFPVEVDGNYGPYLMCNPAQVADGTVNTSDWQCSYNYVPVQWKAMKPSQCAAPCTIEPTSVIILIFFELGDGVGAPVSNIAKLGLDLSMVAAYFEMRADVCCPVSSSP